jgi:ATP-dependent DNA helicase RecG
MDADLLEMARDVAEEMLTQHPELAEKHLQRWLGSREELLKS